MLFYNYIDGVYKYLRILIFYSMWFCGNRVLKMWLFLLKYDKIILKILLIKKSRLLGNVYW